LFRWARPGAGPTEDDIDDADESNHSNSSDVVTSDREPDEDLSLKPSAMRGQETMYGYLIALELIAVSILNLADTHGAGAPTGPQKIFGASLTSRQLSVFGLIVSIALLGVVYKVRHRFVVAFAGIIAAFFVTLPKVPNSLTATHLIALVIPVVYAFILTQRQRKAALAQSQARQRGESTGSGRTAPAQPPKRSRADRAEGQSPLYATEAEASPSLIGSLDGQLPGRPGRSLVGRRQKRSVKLVGAGFADRF
jgi:membrane protein implicated in regulation of membrane protease activity